MSSMKSFTSVKRFRHLLVLTCFPVLLLFSTSAKCYAITKLQSHGQDSIEGIIAREVEKLMKLPGYTAVSGVLYLKGQAHPFHFGKLNNGQKPNDHTVFEIGSIAKTYTGLLLSQAVHDQKINLDDDVSLYLKDKYPNLILSNNKPITIRHLITHTSGLPLVINCSETAGSTAQQASCYKSFTKEDFFRELRKVKIADRSGENYHYSGVGIQLVGYILESVYDSSFDELFQKYVFARFGNRNVFSELNENDKSKVSIGKNDKGQNMPLVNGFYKYAGGLKTTTNSMLNYIKICLESDDIVIRQVMNRLAGSVQYGRAYAWNTFNYDKENKMLYHNGGSFGHSSWIALYPNQKEGIFIVTNVVTADSQGKLNELSNSIMKKINPDHN